MCVPTWNESGSVKFALAVLFLNGVYIPYSFILNPTSPLYLDFYSKEIKMDNTGSVIPHADKGFVLNLEITSPNDLTIINSIFKTIRNETINNNQEIEKITNLRDILLPKLMSGGIDVSEINVD